ncbi:MAG: TetR/AcrR family transcriptional regulator [Cupriavidus necator]
MVKEEHAATVLVLSLVNRALAATCNDAGPRLRQASDAMMIVMLYIAETHTPYHSCHLIMRYSLDQKAETHKHIVKAASTQFRKHGVNGIGVAQLMKSAGLTHGGFYAHFESKDALVAEAIDAAFDQTMELLQEATSVESPRQRKQAIVRAYVNKKHRDNPGAGCAIAALGADVSRLDAKTRRRFEARVTSLIEAIAGDDDETARKDAIVTLAAMVGSIVLARSVRSEALSTEILDALQTSL